MFAGIQACLAEDTLTEDAANKNWLPRQLSLHAFGTLGASYHHEDGIEYRRNVEQKNGVSPHQIDFSSDSVIGAQADLAINEKLSASLQLASRNNAYNNWKPEVITAFVKYSPTESVDIRVGRMLGEANIGGESPYTGYSYVNIRPTPEVFGLLTSYQRYQGVDIQYKHPIFGGVGRIKASYGKVIGERYIAGISDHVNANNSILMLAWQSDNLEIHAARSETHVHDFTGALALSSALAATPFPSAQQRAQEISDTQDHTIIVSGMSAEYAINQFKFIGIYGKFSTGNLPTYHGESSSLLASYRFGNITPFLMVAKTYFTPENRSLILPPIPQVQSLVAGYDFLTNVLTTKQSTISAGFRYEINDNTAFKLQIDHIKASNTPTILSTRPLGENKDLFLMSAALDFIF